MFLYILMEKLNRYKYKHNTELQSLYEKTNFLPHILESVKSEYVGGYITYEERINIISLNRNWWHE